MPATPPPALTVQHGDHAARSWPPSLLQRAGKQRLLWAVATCALLWLALWASMSAGS